MKTRAARLFLSLSTLTMLLMIVVGCGSDDSSTARRSTDDDSSAKKALEELPETETTNAAKGSETDEDSTAEKNGTSTSTTDEIESGKKDETKSAASESSSDSASGGPEFVKTDIDGPWGHLKGQFIYAGEAPALSNLNVTKDTAFCGKHDVPNETLVVNSENGGLANVLVYLYVKRGTDPPPIHESYDETSTSEVRLDNENCRFVPHVCFLRTSQTLVVGNKDAVGHNTKVDAYNNAPINPLTPAGQDFKHQFSKEERGPVAVSCSIHPWMSGWVLVRDNPYGAVTDKDGNFEIKNIPEGEWTFNVWHLDVAL